MQLEVEEIKQLAPIKFNYEDVKKWVTEKAKEYKSIVYTEETMTTAKSDRANLNKLAKAINDEKIRIKKEVLKPFEGFESKCKELESIIKDASDTIDKQVKEVELKEQAEKKENIKAIFDVYVGNYKDLINFDMVFNPRWLNKTFSIKKIEEEIDNLFVKVNEDLTVIDNQIKDENINQSVKNYYFNNISDPSVLGNALQEGLKIEENNKKLEELKRKKEAITRSTEKITDDTQNITDDEKVQQVDFRVWATQSQLMLLKEFLMSNNIKYGRVE